MMVATFAPVVHTMDPTMMSIPMAGSPHHFVVVVPVARPMCVIWLVSYFDSNIIRSESGWKDNARSGYGDEPQF